MAINALNSWIKEYRATIGDIGTNNSAIKLGVTVEQLNSKGVRIGQDRVIDLASACSKIDAQIMVGLSQIGILNWQQSFQNSGPMSAHLQNQVNAHKFVNQAFSNRLRQLGE